MTSVRHCFVSFIFVLGIATLATDAFIRNKGWWRNTVFYQIYPRSFKDSDGDGVGDLKGIKEKLAHFVDAGIGAIWLSPINTSPMKDFGYDVSDFLDIDRTFGTIEDMQELINEAKRLGIKVILDFVPNHTSDQHEWFRKSRNSEGKYKNYYIWMNPKIEGNVTKPPNNWISVFGKSAWTYDSNRKQYYLHQFLPEQPDLNYSNPEVRAEMKHTLMYWMDKGINGFRIDAVPHIFERNFTQDEPRSYLPGVEADEYYYLNHTLTKDDPKTYQLINEWRKIVDDYASNTNSDEIVLMTEAYTNLKNTTKFYKYGSDVPFNFQFIMDVNAKSTSQQFKSIIDNWIKEIPDGCVPNWVMGNHDRNRTASRYPGRGDGMTMLAMTLPGIAVTYYGEEIGMLNYENISFNDTKDPQACIVGPTKYRSKSRDPARTPFQWDGTRHGGFSNSTNEVTWLPVHDNYKELNLAKQKKDTVSHYKVYTALTSLKNSSSILKNGSYSSVAMKDVLAVVRKEDQKTLILLMNFSGSKSKFVNIRDVTNGTMTKTEVKVASVGSAITPGTKIKDDFIELPANATILLYSEYDSPTPDSKPSSATRSENYHLSLILLLLTFFIARR